MYSMFMYTCRLAPVMERSRMNRRSKAVETFAGDAVSYLRVSPEGQVNTDFNPEGISIPAQREAARVRAKEIGTHIVHEFMDPGRSAKSTEHREAFKEMIA